MAKRIRLGIFYSYSENWIGGTYYYQNLINAIDLLDDSQKPMIIIISSELSFKHVTQLNYPYLSFIKLKSNSTNILFDFVKYIQNFIIKFIYNKFKINISQIDILFHPSEISPSVLALNYLTWIPDFQEYYYPSFFSKIYLEFRKKTQSKLLTKKNNLLFSSKDVYNDFKIIYPFAKSNCFVVNFAVLHPNISDISIDSLFKKFNLSQKKYFLVSNQFWKHKNHLIILKAISYIKENYDINYCVLFTGKESDQRDPNFIDILKIFITDNNLGNWIKFLGFVDRKEQLCLMKNAIAIIQPSLFEGWSTVVEDAKLLNQNIIVSNLRVHKEQLSESAYYFNPENELELVDLMIEFLNNNIIKPSFNYHHNMNKFGVDFLNVLNHINPT